MKKPHSRRSKKRGPAILLFLLTSFLPSIARPQAVPYARTYPNSKEDVDKALKDLQAYAGQKLPVVDGFVAPPDQPLNRYERAFYQFSIDLSPETRGGGIIVSVTAKITAWYADRDPSRSGYQVLASNGRLELDLLDRLTEKLGGKPAVPVKKMDVPAPTSRLDLTTGLPGSSLQSGRTSGPNVPDSGALPGRDEVASLRQKRETEEKRMQQLNTELQSLQEVQHNQAHPLNLVVVKKTGTPILARPESGSHLLFNAASGDEFAFLDSEGPWIHVEISGASRGYILRSNLDLPESIAARLKSPNATGADTDSKVFRIEREEVSTFPGNWDALRGKQVRIYTVAPVSDDPKETGPRAKLTFALVLFREFSEQSGVNSPPSDGVLVIFDSADGGIVGSTLANLQQFVQGSESSDNFWKQCYLDPPEAFEVSPKR